ncbi:MAG TPA: GntG family PLP-dependent aldolase, partial [Acidimicrobiales bacterium]|nr:GntG family PLP-dependent aldolase [Acidimicrobiales bacterium]
LEEEYAARVGKPAALYVPSGTMANQLALRVLAPPGSTVVAGRRQHVVAFEHGAAAANAGVQVHAVADEAGLLDPDEVGWALEAAEHHQPRPSMVCVENTHMAAGGAPWELDELRAVRVAAGPLPVHMDGARLFNAEVATGTPSARYAAEVTTVMTCLSKGLCAPVGSVLAGPVEVIAAAREERFRMGGGMRQAGIVAAAGLVALRTMVDRMAEDHARAHRLIHAVAQRWPRAIADPEAQRTNIVVFEHADPAGLLARLEARGVLAGTIAPGRVRLVTHHDVDDEGIDRALDALTGAWGD